jgi:GT2 family glycosyltransferase
LLDHDDKLSINALYEVALKIQEHPLAEIIYSDEDKISERGTRTEPHFKSDWNPDLFYSQNYICHLCVIRHATVKKIGGFREGVEGSQDHDLLLRCIPYIDQSQIIHISKILYHWRVHPASTAHAPDGKSYTSQAGLKAITDYLKDHLPEATTVEQGMQANTYRVRWKIPEPAPLVSLIIPTRDQVKYLAKSVASILKKSDYQNYEIIIIDNGSVEDNTLKYFQQIQKEDARVKIISYNEPFNYSAINNFGVRQASSDIIGLINNDIEVISREWLTEMVSHVMRPEIGCVGSKLYYSDGRIQHGGVILGIGGVAGHAHKYYEGSHPGYFTRLQLIQNLSAVTGACLLLRKEVFKIVGGLNEENLKVAFNDVDLCLKVQEAGYRNLWTPYAELYHHESTSRGLENTPEKIERFNSEVEYMIDKWSARLQYDPYYSRNLTKTTEDFSIIH